MSYRELPYEEKEKIIQELEKLTGGDDRSDAYDSLKDDVDDLAYKFGLFFAEAGGNPGHNDRIKLGFNIERLNKIGMLKLGIKICEYGADTIEMIFNKYSGTDMDDTRKVYFELWFD